MFPFGIGLGEIALPEKVIPGITFLGMNVKRKSERREKLVVVKLTRAELERLRQALRDDETVSAFVRAAALHLCDVRAARETI